jgi:2-haloacid dehalogenase
MTIRALIFDIGGTVFDWNTPVVETLKHVVPQAILSDLNLQSFSLDARARFMDLNGQIMRGEQPWLTANHILTSVMETLCEERGLHFLSAEAKAELAKAWRRMPAWDGARPAIAALRGRYMIAPLTILSCPMAIDSSRKNGIDWDLILSCDLLGFYKPDPRCYARAAEILDCKPDEMMMVAAHPSDLRAAISAGYRSAYILPKLEDPGDDYTDTGFATEFDFVARDFVDLAENLLK